MTPLECFRLATAIQAIATVSYPCDEQNDYPSDEIALWMGEIAGLAHRIKNGCINIDPAVIRKVLP